MKPSRILPILWLVTSIGVFIAAAQDWYAVIEPSPGLSRVAATGLESFPLLATIPWISIICLLLIWYLGSIGRLLVAGLTALLALAGVAQLAIQSINTEVLLGKLEKATGIRQTVSDLLVSTVELWPKNLTVTLLILLAAISVSSLVIRLRRLGNQSEPVDKSGRKGKVESNGHDLWDEQNHD